MAGGYFGVVGGSDVVGGGDVVDGGLVAGRGGLDDRATVPLVPGGSAGLCVCWLIDTSAIDRSPKARTGPAQGPQAGAREGLLCRTTTRKKCPHCKGRGGDGRVWIAQRPSAGTSTDQAGLLRGGR